MPLFMPLTSNPRDIDQNMASPNGSDTKPLVQLLAQLVRGRQTFEQAMTQILAHLASESAPATTSQPNAPKASGSVMDALGA